MNTIIECIPNISEGRNIELIKELENVFSKFNEVKLLNTSIGYHANRTVFTIAGNPKQMIEAMDQFYGIALKNIDMRKHSGVHPRSGAIDVCPFVPLKGISMNDANNYAIELGEIVAEKYGIPVFFYEKTASVAHRQSLSSIRKGEYEGWQYKISLPEWKPDRGLAKFNRASGITVIGARNFLLAYNVNVDNCDLDIVKVIARQMRESGISIQHGSRILHQPGMLHAVKAIGWYISDFKRFQVSMNLTDLNVTPMHVAFETVKKLAGYYNAKVTGSELIGMMPMHCLSDAIAYYGVDFNDLPKAREEVVKIMGLHEISPFIIKDRIIEYKLGLV